MVDQELKGEHQVEEPAVQGDFGRPVEVLKATGLLEAGRPQPEVGASIIPAADLVGQSVLQEGRVVQLLSTSRGHALWQGVEHGAELEALEQGRQFGIAGHGRSPCLD